MKQYLPSKSFLSILMIVLAFCITPSYSQQTTITTPTGTTRTETSTIDATSNCLDGGTSPFHFANNPQAKKAVDAIDRELFKLKQQQIDIDKICPELPGLLQSTNRNIQAIQQNLNKLRSMAESINRTGGGTIPFPRSCTSSVDCYPGSSACVNLDPCDPNTIHEFRKRLMCLQNAGTSAASSGMGHFGTGGDLLKRWQEGMDHRAFMAAYNDIFSTLSNVLNFLTDNADFLDGISDPVKDRIKSAIQDMAVEEVEKLLGPVQAKRLKELQQHLETGKEIYDAISLARDLIKAARGGVAINPAWVFQLNGALYDAAAQMTGVAVKGWEAFRLSMNNEIFTAYKHYLCALQFFNQLRQNLLNCRDFCGKAERCNRSRKEQLENDRKSIIDQAEEAIAARYSEMLNPLLNDALNARAICQWTEGQNVNISIPGAQGPLANYLRALLTKRFGQQFCFMKVHIRIICRRGMSPQVDYKYEFSPHGPFHNECCKTIKDSDLIPPFKKDPSTGLPSEGNPPAENPGDGRVGNPHIPPNNPGIPGIPGSPIVECDCGPASLHFSGRPMFNNRNLSMKLGTRVNLIFNGTCKGGPQCAKETVLWISRPNVGQSRKFSRSLPFSFDQVGIYTFFLQHKCGGKVCTEIKFKVKVEKPGNPDQGNNEDNKQGKDLACGNQKCIQVGWLIQPQRKFQPLLGDEIAVKKPTIMALRQANSTCFSGRRNHELLSEWEIQHPSGLVKTLRGHQINYNFREKGSYLICVHLIDKKTGKRVSRSFRVVDRWGNN